MAIDFTNEEKNLITVIIDGEILNRTGLIERIKRYRSHIDESNLVEMIKGLETKLMCMTDDEYFNIDLKPELDLVEEEE